MSGSATSCLEHIQQTFFFYLTNGIPHQAIQHHELSAQIGADKSLDIQEKRQFCFVKAAPDTIW